MIRINLLGVERTPKRAAPAFEWGQKLPLLCSLILIASVLFVGWWFWSLRNESQRLDEEIVTAQQETERLRSVLAQLETIEARKAQLEQRVKLIEELRRGQSGPVHMLDEISRSLPDRLWLTEMKQEGTALTLDGRASTLTALSDFVGNLESSSYFKSPVEIINSQLEGQPTGDLIKFSVKAEIAANGGD